MKKQIWLVTILAVIIVILAGALLLWPKQNVPQVEGDVVVFSPKPGDNLQSPLVVEGKARGTWFFEASFPIKITDESGNVLGSSFVQATSDWMTENYVPFRGEITFTSKAAGKGFLVLQKDNPSGLPQNDKEIKIPVNLPLIETMKVKVFFNNNKMDPEVSCNKVFPVEREIPKTESTGSASLLELFKGPTEEEKNAGFFTSINDGVRLQTLMIGMDSGIARADFNEQLQAGVGGSCKVSAIRAQITETLKQFSTIKSVEISINGRTEDILQP